MWLSSHQQWGTAGIAWEPGREPGGQPPREVPAPPAGAAEELWAGEWQYPPGSPEFGGDYTLDKAQDPDVGGGWPAADPPARSRSRRLLRVIPRPARNGDASLPGQEAGEVPAPPAAAAEELWAGEWERAPGVPEFGADAAVDEAQPDDRERDAGPPCGIWQRPSFLQHTGERDGEGGTLLLEPARGRSDGRRRPRVRRAAAIVVPAVVLLAVSALTAALLTGHGPKPGSLAASQQGTSQLGAGNQGPAPLALSLYPGQQPRGVFQTAGRIVSSGNTIVAIGSQASDGAVRQQFFVSGNSGVSWQLAPARAAGGGQAPPGYPAARLAGGSDGWLATGPQATWTSRNGLSWTLAAAHGVTPQQPGDAVWVLNSTSGGFLAAGVRPAGGGQTQAVIWMSRDGLTWQRKTAAQLGLASPGETVQSISYATARGDDTVISGMVAKDGTTYSGAWLSTNGGATWTRVTVPVDHGAGTSINGLGFDGSGLVAVRAGHSAAGASDGVAYFSPDGRTWQYAAAMGAAAGWTPSLVKGSTAGFVAVGATTAGQIVAYTSTGTGGAWQPAAPLGDAASEAIAGATVGAGGAVVAIGSAAASNVSQQPVFLEAGPAGGIKHVPLASIPGAVIPELAVNGLAVAAGQQIAVGSADGYPAIWRQAGGSWPLVSPPPAAAAADGKALRALTGVTHGSAGWLAVGAPGPVVFTSATGTTWQRASGPGSITAGLAGVSAVAAAAGPAGYVIVGNLVVPGACVADVWWSPDLTSWTRARDVNDTTGSSQVLAVAAGPHGFVSAGSHDGKPAVWTSRGGRSWETIVLPVPAGAVSAVLEQVAISGSRVVALGRASTTAEPDTGGMPLAEVSTDGGAHWQQVPFTAPGPDSVFTALTADPAGFTAAGQFGQQGQREIAAWTSAAGTSWTQSKVSGGPVGQPGGSFQVTALAPSGSAVTGISLATSQETRQAFTVIIHPG